MVLVVCIDPAFIARRPAYIWSGLAGHVGHSNATLITILLLKGSDSVTWLQLREYEIIGKGSQISTNQKPGNSAFSLLIG